MAELRPELLASDVADTPAWLRRVVDAHEDIGPLALEARGFEERLMGSSRYAALNAAAYLRSLGRDAHAENASTGSPQPAEPGLLVVAVSAGGGSRETIAAARRHRGTSTVLGVTNRPDAALAAEVDTCLELHAGEERSGVACRSSTNTLALLLLLCGIDAARVRAGADASAAVIDTTDEWLGPAADLVGRPAIHVLAPAERIGSAEQSALMSRRRRSDASRRGTRSGAARARIEIVTGSCATAGTIALHHTMPSLPGARSTVAHGRTCGCSIGPISVRPSRSSASRIHSCVAVSHSGSVHFRSSPASTRCSVPRVPEPALVTVTRNGLAESTHRVHGLSKSRPKELFGNPKWKPASRSGVAPAGRLSR